MRDVWQIFIFEFLDEKKREHELETSVAKRAKDQRQRP